MLGYLRNAPQSSRPIQTLTFFSIWLSASKPPPTCACGSAINRLKFSFNCKSHRAVLLSCWPQLKYRSISLLYFKSIMCPCVLYFMIVSNETKSLKDKYSLWLCSPLIACWSNWFIRWSEWIGSDIFIVGVFVVNLK